MAAVKIELTDTDDGGIHVVFESDPPLDLRYEHGEKLTSAQLYALQLLQSMSDNSDSEPEILNVE